MNAAEAHELYLRSILPRNNKLFETLDEVEKRIKNAATCAERWVFIDDLDICTFCCIILEGRGFTLEKESTFGKRLVTIRWG